MKKNIEKQELIKSEKTESIKKGRTNADEYIEQMNNLMIKLIEFIVENFDEIKKDPGYRKDK